MSKRTVGGREYGGKGRGAREVAMDVGRRSLQQSVYSAYIEGRDAS